MIKSIKIQNFTVFKDVKLDFSPGINAIIGENGTGKTHLLKIIYAMHVSHFIGKNQTTWDKALKNVFRPSNNKLTSLIRHNADRADIRVERSGMAWNLSLERLSEIDRIESNGGEGIEEYPVFIPSKEVLSHAKGFRSLYEKSDIPFDQTFRDILDLSFYPELREQKETLEPLIQKLSDRMGGTIRSESDEFILVTKDNQEISMQLVAEGLRKIAVLWLLIRNGKLFDGKMLFWDEPETSLNPALMPLVIDVLLALEELGIQIFLTSHSYPFLKALELQKKKQNKIKFFSFYFDSTGAVKAADAPDYTTLKPNKILDEYMALFDMEVERSLGEKG